MESDILQASQKILKCFICLGIFTDPVLLRCGHTFCRACLFLISENIQIPAYCPMCRQPSQWEFRTDITMKKLVSIVKKERFMKYLSSEEHKCVTHKERKMIFCDENRVLLCQLCSDSQEHRGHRHCPTEVAIGEQMEKILKQMESLRKKIQEQQENLEAERRMATKWVGYVTVREQMIRMAYRKLHPALDEEENQHIKCMKNEGNTILEELRKSEAMMAHKKSQLIEAYQELMTMSQKPYEVLLLQDLDDMFRRSELVQLGMPQRMKPKLSAHPNTGLTARFNFFQVLPRNTIPTPSSRVEEGSPKSSIKVEPKKDQHATHVLRQSHHRNIAAPLHADEHQVRACTSRDNPQAEATALTKHTDNATSDEDQKKRPLRKVKVPIKKNRHVLPECADNTLDKGKAHLKVAKVESKRCKCLSSILKKFSRKKTVAPLVVKRPQVLPGAFTETAQITTEVLPENADAAPSAGGQGEPPVGMAKEERKTRRHIFSLLRGICQKTSVTTQDTKRPSASEGPLTKTTEIKTQDIPENTDAPDEQKNTPETMESVEARRRRRISELLKRIEQKQATAFQDVMGPEVCKVSSAETAVQNKKENATAPSPVDEEKTSESSVQVEPTRFKCFFSLLQRFSKKDPHPSQAWAEPPGPPSTSKETSANEKGMQNVPDIKELFFKKEEFEPHDEGSWEEYQSYFPHGVHVPDSRQTMASTMVESYVAQVGDTDVEEQEQLDSKENFPDAYEVQHWEMRKRASTLSPAVNTLFVHRPGSSESDEESTPIRRKKRRYKRRL